MQRSTCRAIAVSAGAELRARIGLRISIGWRTARGSALALVIFAAVGAAPAAAATLTVNTTADELTSGDGLCSLREAVAAADVPGSASDCGTASAVVPNTIVLGTGHYGLVFPPQGADGNSTGDLNAEGTAALKIVGSGMAATVIDASTIGGLHDRVLSVAGGATVTLAQLTLTGGHAVDGAAGSNGSGGNAFGGEEGGAIFNDGSLTLEDAAVTNSSAGNGGKGGSGKVNETGTGGPGGKGGEGGQGGGIFNNSIGTLTLIGTTISGNQAGSGGAGGEGGKGNIGGVGGTGGVGPEDGGGVSSEGGTVTIKNSTIANNLAGAGGTGGTGGQGKSTGGIGGNGGSASWGGGISALKGKLSVTNSTITANAGGEGGKGGSGGQGGFEEDTGPPDFEVICFAGTGGNGGDGGNGGNGGGIRATEASSTLLHVTLAGNHVGFAGQGGEEGFGICEGKQGKSGNYGGDASGGELFVQGTAAMTLENAIVSGNAIGGNCAGGGPINPAGHLDLSFGDTTCPGTIGDPKLGPLQDNGGPTETMALGAGSPALDQVPGSGSDCPATDQRGVARPQGSGCDLGAYELAPPAAVTGGASAITQTDATVAGSVTANAADATVRFEYGTTTAYGSETAVQHVSGVTPTAVSTMLTGLSANTTYHYRVIASTPSGTATGGDATFTTSAAVSATGGGLPGGAAGLPGGSAGLPGGALKATLSSLTETNAVFSVGGAVTPLAGRTAARHHARGTVFSFVLDRVATVRIVIQSSVPGRRVGRSCKAASRSLGHRPRCTLTTTRAVLTRAAHAGRNRVAFSGRMRGKALKPGRYLAVFTAVDAAGPSAPRSLQFTIVRR